MSRIGRLPVAVPSGVKVQVEGTRVRVQGPKGKLERAFPSEMRIQLKEGALHVERPGDSPQLRALHGMTRALLNNMVLGVSRGFDKALQVEGVGYRPELEGKTLVLYVGYSHPMRVDPPDGVSFEVDTRARTIRVIGRDKELVGQVAADIRKIRPPEPYKGKGIRYLDEHVRRKAGKAGKVA
ncbi:MAG: 50S ribosomal protein L6 [Chloroflexota bacterium]